MVCVPSLAFSSRDSSRTVNLRIFLFRRKFLFYCAWNVRKTVCQKKFAKRTLLRINLFLKKSFLSAATYFCSLSKGDQYWNQANRPPGVAKFSLKKLRYFILYFMLWKLYAEFKSEYFCLLYFFLNGNAATSAGRLADF